jgi:hypothetical protein
MTGAVLLMSIGYVIWDRNFRKASARDPGLTCPTVIPARSHRVLAAVGVHRVMLIGDSIMDQASCSIADSLAGVGIQTTRHALPGTGLLTGFDWVANVTPLIEQEHPDIVMAIFVGNYAEPYLKDANGQPILRDTPEFRTAYVARAAALSKAVHAAGASMYWVSPPPFAFPPFQQAGLLFQGYAKLPGDHIVDAGGSLADPGNKEVVIKSTCGRKEFVRASDIAHLTPDGARIYGQTIAHNLTAQLGLLTTPRPC